MPFIALITLNFVILEAWSNNSNCGSFLSSVFLFVFIHIIIPPLCVCVFQTLILKYVRRDNVKPKMLIFFFRKDFVFFFASGRCLGHYYSGILSIQYQRQIFWSGLFFFFFFCEVLCFSRSLQFLGCSLGPKPQKKRWLRLLVPLVLVGPRFHSLSL